MRILGIETSCDETAAAVLSSPLRVESSVVASQIEDHRPYGGVVPEVAAREHVQALPVVLQKAVDDAGIAWGDLDGIAVTQGPGLSSSLLSGLTSGWSLAKRLGVPFYPVHHLEGHLLSLFFSLPDLDVGQICPALVLLVTGGHTSLVRMNAPGKYEVLGRSIDDAAGEALDKGARLLGLDYPGGPEIERLAVQSESREAWFPLGTPDGEEAVKRGGQFPFSFSGLKTALRYDLQKRNSVALPDMAYAYQHAVMETLVKRVSQALDAYSDFKTVACVGGVAKNKVLNSRLQALAGSVGTSWVTVPMDYCTDNAAMIAAVPLLRSVEPAQAFPAADPNLPLLGLRLR
jgi:N6-L-threonylcarbamoyladenine synthase